jgi:hypothetical protein
LLQCGTTLVFAVPPLWKNEKEQDERLRKATAVLGKSVSLVLSKLHLFISSCYFTPISQKIVLFQSCAPLMLLIMSM